MDDGPTGRTSASRSTAPYQVGELHVSADGNQVYFHSERAGGLGEMDIWVTSKVNGPWQTPENVEAVNSAI